MSVLFRSHDKAWGVKVTFPKYLNWTRIGRVHDRKVVVVVVVVIVVVVYKNGKKSSKIMGNKYK
jgi:hypothetical protein